MKSIALRSMFCLPALMLTTLVAQSAEEKIKPENLPKTVAEAVKARFPSGKIREAAKEEDKGKVVFDIELTMDDRKYETDIQEDGTMIEVEKEIASKDVPVAITRAVDAKYPKATIKEVMEVDKVKGKDENPDHYEVTIKTADDKEIECLLTLDGRPFEE
jgi:uncharacterized membrane protein YkoI